MEKWPITLDSFSPKKCIFNGNNLYILNLGSIIVAHWVGATDTLVFL